MANGLKLSYVPFYNLCEALFFSPTKKSYSDKRFSRSSPGDDDTTVQREFLLTFEGDTVREEANEVDRDFGTV